MRCPTRRSSHSAAATDAVWTIRASRRLLRQTIARGRNCAGSRDHREGEAESAMPGRVISRAESCEACDVRSDDGVRVAGDRDGAAVIASGSGPAFAQILEKGLARRSGCLGPGRADSAQRVRVAAAQQRERTPTASDRPPSGYLGDEIVMSRQHRSVSRFDGRDLVQEREVGIERHLSAIEEQQVVEREEHARFAQTRGDVEDVAAGAAAPPGAAPP